MDDLETLLAVREDVDPSPAVRDAHRHDLRAEIDSAIGGETSDGTRAIRSRQKWLLVAGAAVAACVVVIASLAIAEGGGGGTTKVATRPRTNHPLERPTTIPGICGPSLPINVSAPAGFAGPTPGPSAMNTVSPDPSRFVEHWESPTGSIDVLWPPDPDIPGPDPTRPFNQDAASSATPGAPDANGNYLTAYYAPAGSNTLTQCQAVQIEIRAPSPTDRDLIFQQVLTALVGKPALISGTDNVETLPTAIACRAPAGTPAPPNQTGTGDGTSFPSSDEALRAFVGTKPSVPQAGYRELDLTDGTIAFAAPAIPTGTGYVVVVHVVPADNGWLINSWETSGC
jgi:hypothetical protein